MKSEREFLEGIYQKAALVEEKSSHSKLHPYRKYCIVLTAALLAFIILPVGISGLRTKNPGDIGANPRVEPNSISYRTIVKSTNVFDGRVEAIRKEEEEYIINVHVEESYVGEPLQEVTVRYPIIESDTIIKLEKGEKALFSVIEHEGNYYVNEDEYGICRFLEIENTEKVYESKYGIKIYTKDIK